MSDLGEVERIAKPSSDRLVETTSRRGPDHFLGRIFIRCKGREERGMSD
jgi:hypothetical protein